MTDPFSRIRRFLRELKRRNVYKVAVTYVAVAFVGLQAVNLLIPATTLPGWADQLFLGLVILGLPVSVVVAWAFEMTAEGMRRTPEAEEGPAGKSAYQWIGLTLVIALAGSVWYATAGTGGEPSLESPATGDSAARRGGTAADSAAAALPARDRPYVAVLPLENLSPREENRFFAAGVHEEILNQLSRVSGLGVFARTTMQQYADSDQTVYEIGRELGAEAVLEGSVRRAAGRVRISAQLIDPESRDHAWSKTYERELSPEKIFEIQADIAGRITSALETELPASERNRIAEAPTSDIGAYDAYLKGRNAAMDAWHLLEPRPLDSAVEHLRAAVRQDSTFAEAHAWLGFAYGSRSYFSGEDRWSDSASSALDRALAIDTDLSDAYAIQGLHYQLESLQAAEKAYRKALRLDPDNRLAADGMADLAAFAGEYGEAIRWAHRVLRVDPRWEYGRSYMGNLLLTIGMGDAAAAWFRDVLDTNPDNATAVWGLMSVFLSRGQAGRAHETVERYRSGRPDHPIGLRLAAEVALHRGSPQRAEELLERVPESGRRVAASALPGDRRMLIGLARLRSGNREAGRTLLREAADSLRDRLDERSDLIWQTDPLWLARALAALGQTEDALRHLHGAMERGEIRQQIIRSDPFFQPIRSEPRFREVLQKMAATQREFQEELRQIDIALYPPGTNPDSVALEITPDG